MTLDAAILAATERPAIRETRKLLAAVTFTSGEWDRAVSQMVRQVERHERVNLARALAAALTRPGAG